MNINTQNNTINNAEIVKNNPLKRKENYLIGNKNNQIKRRKINLDFSTKNESLNKLKHLSKVIKTEDIINTKVSANGRKFIIIKKNNFSFIFKPDKSRSIKESFIYKLSIIYGYDNSFVPTISLNFNQTIGSFQYYLDDPNIILIDDESIINGNLQITFETLIKTIIMQIQFGVDDGISENLFFDSKNDKILHFDNETLLPLSNELTIENEEESLPPFKSILLGHPLCYNKLENNQIKLIQELTTDILNKETIIINYFNAIKSKLTNIENFCSTKVLSSWLERSQRMYYALEKLKKGGIHTLIEFILDAIPSFLYLKYYQLAAELIIEMKDKKVNILDEQASQIILQKTMGDAGNLSNYLPDIKSELEEYEEYNDDLLMKYIEKSIIDKVPIKDYLEQLLKLIAIKSHTSS